MPGARFRLYSAADRTRGNERGDSMGGEVNKVVLAYSGGLDTSVILRWLKDAYRCEVVTSQR